MIDEILNLVERHEQWRGRECLNLIPSENITSPAVRGLLASELGHRYTARERFYMGTKFIDEIEEYGEKLAREVFEAETADLRPLSGHIADLIFLASFTKPGDTLMCISPEDGGYPGLWIDGLSGLLGLKVFPIPFCKEDMRVEVEKARDAIIRVKPKALIFGASLILFPHPVRELADVARENGAVVGFDGSHVLGLIAGKRFQAPLKEGANALFGSTHKSLFGPQGGIILADEEHGEVVKAKIYLRFVDNAHWNRIAALTLALAEMKSFGGEYAKQVIRNAKALAKALYEHGFPVKCPKLGFTESHQVIIDFGRQELCRKVAEKLQEANIIVDCVVRVGTCEVTRRGMKEGEMAKIAELMRRVVLDGENPEAVKRDVLKLCSEFQTIGYCFR
jgi:Glycine/serine hydroxymethyltransferase